jgi:hypothetical protein
VTILLLSGAALFLYFLITRPGIIVILFFTITIADINFEIGALPLNIRAIIGLALFGRTLIGNKENNQPVFIANINIRQIIFFLGYTVLITALYDIIKPAFIKQTALTFITVYCGYFYFFKNEKIEYLKISLLLSGIICFSDLLYTYATAGEFPVQRVFLYLLGVPPPVDEMGRVAEVYNHNFFGQVCGMSFIVLLNDYINNRNVGKVKLLLLPIMGLGVLMSTSRSSLLAAISISLILLFRELKHYSRAKRVYKIFGMLLVAVFLSLFVFTFLQDYFNLSSEFIENITFRLIDEPIQVINKNLGNNYNVQQLDAMDWREEAAANAWNKFLGLDFSEQLFGIGTTGFLERNLGKGLNPHNGMLLLVIESGIFGLCFYFYILINIVKKSFKGPNISSYALTVIFVVIFCIGQNEELTSSSTLIFAATLIAETDMLTSEAFSTKSEIAIIE